MTAVKMLNTVYLTLCLIQTSRVRTPVRACISNSSGNHEAFGIASYIRFFFFLPFHYFSQGINRKAMVSLSTPAIALGNHGALGTFFQFFFSFFIQSLSLFIIPFCFILSFIFTFTGDEQEAHPRGSTPVHCSFYKVRHGGRDVNWYQVLSGVDGIRPRITSPDLFESSTGTLVPQNDLVPPKQKSNCIAPLYLFCLRQCQTVMMTTLYRVQCIA